MQDAPPREHSKLTRDTRPIVIDVDAPDTHACLDRALEVLSERAALTPERRSEIERAFEVHANNGIDLGQAGVAILWEQLASPGPELQLLLRLQTPLPMVAGSREPVRFLWILLSPGANHAYMNTAVEFARLMQRPRFREQLLAAKTPDDLSGAYDHALDRVVHFEDRVPPELQPTTRWFQGLLDDIRRRLPLYGSDWADGLSPKTLASTLFLYFACLAPAVAFGGLVAILTEGQVGAIEMIVATAICGVVYALLSAQPLTILGSTGPIIIFIGILYGLCERLGLPFIPTYAWVGFWTAGFMFLLSFGGASSLIRFFTRFTDDTFAALIAIIFIAEAVNDTVHVFTDHEVSYATALLSLVLALGTFQIAMALSRFRRSPYLRRGIREFFADFGPTIAIMIMSGVAFALHEVELETLAVPLTLQTTSGRPWLVDPFVVPIWVWFASAVPAGLVSILLYMDQNITTRLVNSPDFKLRKPAGYHLDMAVVALLVAVCSALGLPWMIAATVRSLNHVRSLAKVDSEGGGERVTGVVETRLTGLLVHALVGLSLLMLPLLAEVPMSVLFGLFLFMGVASMGGNQLFERLRLWFVDPGRYPPTHYLRVIPRRVVHRFTAIQAGCLIVLWVVKSSSYGILFPLFIALLVPVRMSLDRFFEPAQLALLDSEETPEEEETREVE